MNRELRERWKKAKGEVLGMRLTVEAFKHYGSGCSCRTIHVAVRRYQLYDCVESLRDAIKRTWGQNEESQAYYLKKAKELSEHNNGDCRYLGCGDDLLEMRWQESQEDDRRDQFYAPHVETDWTDRAFEVWSKLRKAVGEYRDAPLYQQGLGPRSTVKWLLGRRNVVPTKHLHLPDRGYGETVIDADFDIDARLPVFEKPQPEPVIEQPELAVVA